MTDVTLYKDGQSKTLSNEQLIKALLDGGWSKAEKEAKAPKAAKKAEE